MRAPLLSLVVVGLCQCGTPGGGASAADPFAVTPTDRIEIEYRADGTSLALCNASAEQAGTVARANLKVANHEDLALLLGGFEDCGYFAAAAGTPAPNAKATMIVRLNDRTLVRSRQPLTAPQGAEARAEIEQLTEFNQCLALFQQVYNGTTAFTATSGIDKDDLERQNELMRRRAQEALKRSREGK